MEMIKMRAWNPDLNKMLSWEELQPYALSSVSYGYLKYQRWTGLTDRNGNEVYEGDIIQTDTLPQIIKWSDTVPGWAMWLGKGATTGIPNVFEVIGNIYEDKTLLIGPKGFGTTESA